MTTPHIIVTLAVIISITGFSPQVIKILKTKKVDDIAIAQPVMIALGMIAWTVYGIMIKDYAIIISNIIVFFLNTTVIGLKIYYSNKTR